jgi:glucose/arabinose dehydrogenase
MKKRFHLLLISTFLPAIFFCQVIKIEPLSTGLLYPICIQNTGIPNDNRLFVVEKRGRIKIVNSVTGSVTPVPFLDIYSKVYPITTVFDERGLLGLAFHPNYSSNGYFYVNYVTPNGKTVISRYQVSAFPDTAIVGSEQIIMTIHQPFSNHKGGNLMFGPEDGYLYVSLGDGGSSGDPGNRAQNIDSLHGKTLRIDINNPTPPYYFSAPGNPFYGSVPGRDEIFDLGLRNPWRCSFDRLTHDLWIGDVGQSNYEEINFRSKCDTVGHNYGWRCYEGNTGYNTSGCLPLSNFTPPVFVYDHSFGCSVTGGYVYRGAQENSLFGKYLFADYCQGRIWATVPNGVGGWNTNQLTQQNLLITNNIASFGEDVDGELYLAGVSSGLIYRLRDTACAPVAYIHEKDSVFVCSTNPTTLTAIKGVGLTYSWTVSSNGTWTINGGQGTNALSLTPDISSPAIIWVTVSNGTCSSISNSVVVIAGASFTGLGSMYCVTNPSVNLTASLAGGVFSGAGISGNGFNPSNAGLGTHVISYTFADTLSSCYYKSSNCSLTYTQSVVVSMCSGINEQNEFLNVRVFPNPSNADFNVEYYSLEPLELEVKISDALGRTVFNGNIETKVGQQNFPIKLANVEGGIYFLFLKTDKFVYEGKIIVSK